MNTDVPEILKAILSKTPIQLFESNKWVNITQEEAENYSITELKANYFRVAPSTTDVTIKDMPIPVKEELEMGEKYYTFSFPSCSVDSHLWDGDSYDLHCLTMGVCYRSNTDALEAVNRLKVALSI